MNRWLENWVSRVTRWAEFNAKHNLPEAGVWTGGAFLAGFLIGLIL